MQHNELFDTLSQNLQELESDILLLEEQPHDVERLARIFSVLGLEAQQWGGAEAKKVLDSYKKGRIHPSQATVDAFMGLVEAIKRVFYLAAVDDSEKDASFAPRANNAVASRVPTSEAANPTHSVPNEPELQETADSAVTAPPTGEIDRQQPPETPQQSHQKEQAFIKVNTRKLDELMESVQELVISSTMMGQRLERGTQPNADRAENMGELLEHDRCIDAIRQHVLDIRKVTLRATCTRMARLVREVAQSVGKQVELASSGQEVEVDKSVLDDLADPLIHLLRNAVDHGIEPPEQRQALGKPAAGGIRLDASYENGELVLRIVDDGRGLDKERILAKAKERGLASPDKNVDDFSDRELFGLILQPGFSTAETVSNVSGRGVGMDVVAQSLRAMQGELEISSKQGQGSSFTIRVPADKASLEGISQGVLVQVGGQHFVLRSGCVREVFRPNKGAVHTLAQEGEVVATRHGTLGFYRTHCLLGLEPLHAEPHQGLAVVVESGQELIVLQVDDVLGERQVVVRTFAGMRTFLGETLFSGVAFIGSMTAMILDADLFLHNAKQANQYLCCRFAVCSPEDLR